MAEVTEVLHILDAERLNIRVVALVNFLNRITIAPDSIFQVVLDPARFSKSRKFIHLDQRKQRTDAHGWFPVDCISVLEILGEAKDEKGDDVAGGIYAKPLSEVTSLVPLNGELTGT